MGEAGRDVDHDLFAAGHPQMKFEMAGYHDAIPAHWNITREQKQTPKFQEQLWVSGQFASVEAALHLLELRAAQATQPAEGKNAWPEFAEYDCFACHHDLLNGSWRRERAFTQSGKRILWPWGVWHYALLPELAKDSPTGNAFYAAYFKLQSTMQSQFRPDPELIRDQARRNPPATSSLERRRREEFRLRAPGGVFAKPRQTGIDQDLGRSRAALSRRRRGCSIEERRPRQRKTPGPAKRPGVPAGLQQPGSISPGEKLGQGCQAPALGILETASLAVLSIACRVSGKYQSLPLPWL